MGNLIADIFVTVKPTIERIPLTVRSLASLLESTSRDQFRLTLCFDGHTEGMSAEDPDAYRMVAETSRLRNLQKEADYVLRSLENEGLGPTINRAVAHIKSINDWYLDPHVGIGDPDRVAPFIVMCQDDLLYTRNWLPVLASRFMAYEHRYCLGFASGVECIEHPVRKVIGEGMVTKDYIRAAQMMGRREYWQSMMPIPRFDPETGRVRARPNDGIGSGVDWHLIRNHERSVCRTRRTCLVMPGLVQHAGYDRSTWLNRELPESEADKERVRNG